MYISSGGGNVWLPPQILYFVMVQVSFCFRENELLKHQLKKYVNAVQMLRREGARDEGVCMQCCLNNTNVWSYTAPGIHLDKLLVALTPLSELVFDSN